MCSIRMLSPACRCSSARMRGPRDTRLPSTTRSGRCSPICTPSRSRRGCSRHPAIGAPAPTGSLRCRRAWNAAVVSWPRRSCAASRRGHWIPSTRPPIWVKAAASATCWAASRGVGLARPGAVSAASPRLAPARACPRRRQRERPRRRRAFPPLRDATARPPRAVTHARPLRRSRRRRRRWPAGG